MIKKRTVFPADHHGVRAPLMSSVVIYMALDLYHMPGWLWGVMGTLMFVLWAAWFALLWNQEIKPLPGYGEQDERRR